MAAPFIPLPSSSDKAHVPKWIPPEPTKMELDWADLRTIELSLLNSPDPEVVAKLVATTKAAIKEDGFLFLTDYGVSLEQVNLSSPFSDFLLTENAGSFTDNLTWLSISMRTFLRKIKIACSGIHPLGVFEGFKPRYGWKASYSQNQASFVRYIYIYLTMSNYSA
jgi:hypothetical protein